MKKNQQIAMRILISLSLLLLTAFALVGCSELTAPTASTESQAYSEMWNPQPGDMINGHEVPLLEEGYWESHYGPMVNPAGLPPRTFRVGPQGGDLSFGPHHLIIPQGAINGQIWITLSNGSLTGLAIDCNPSPYQFNAAVTLVTSYAGTQYEGDDDPPLSIIYMAPDGSLETLPSVVNSSLSTLTAQTNHFSRYIVG